MKLSDALGRIRSLKESIDRLENLFIGEEIKIRGNTDGRWDSPLIVSETTARAMVKETLKARHEELSKLQGVVDLAEAALRGLDK